MHLSLTLLLGHATSRVPRDSDSERMTKNSGNVSMTLKSRDRISWNHVTVTLERREVEEVAASEW